MNSIIKLTPNAIQQMKKIVTNNNSKSLFLQLKGGGCNGFNYSLKTLDTIESPNKLDETVKKDDVIVHVCGHSMMHLLGTEVDWKDDIMGANFVFNNPNAESQCGCGSSFSPIN